VRGSWARAQGLGLGLGLRGAVGAAALLAGCCTGGRQRAARRCSSPRSIAPAQGAAQAPPAGGRSPLLSAYPSNPLTHHHLARRALPPRAEYRDLAVYGLQNEAALVQEGDLYLCYTCDDMEAQAARALELGCHAIVATRELAEGTVPKGVPVVVMPDLVDVQQRLAVAFYGARPEVAALLAAQRSCWPRRRCGACSGLLRLRECRPGARHPQAPACGAPR
jgi:hypothetical protein